MARGLGDEPSCLCHPDPLLEMSASVDPFPLGAPPAGVVLGSAKPKQTNKQTTSEDAHHSGELDWSLILNPRAPDRVRPVINNRVN